MNTQECSEIIELPDFDYTSQGIEEPEGRKK
jgi:hypothetical protein